MSSNNGVIRIGRKGVKKFAFGDDGAPFDVDVVVAFQQWIAIDSGFRAEEENAEGSRHIPIEQMVLYHQAAVEFISHISDGQKVTTAEALDFLARLREQYDELATFFRPRSRDEQESPATSALGLRFSEEPAS